MRQVIRLHPAAAPKPVEGAPCNGCGVCCAAEPCPIGIVVSRRRRGACAALTWVDELQRYRCGLLHDPKGHLPVRLHRWAPMLARLAHRYIAAGLGCDCSDVVEHTPLA